MSNSNASENTNLWIMGVGAFAGFGVGIAFAPVVAPVVAGALGVGGAMWATTAITVGVISLTSGVGAYFANEAGKQIKEDSKFAAGAAAAAAAAATAAANKANTAADDTSDFVKEANNWLGKARERAAAADGPGVVGAGGGAGPAAPARPGPGGGGLDGHGGGPGPAGVGGGRGSADRRPGPALGAGGGDAAAAAAAPGPAAVADAAARAAATGATREAIIRQDFSDDSKFYETVYNYRLVVARDILNSRTSGNNEEKIDKLNRLFSIHIDGNDFQQRKNSFVNRFVASDFPVPNIANIIPLSPIKLRTFANAILDDAIATPDIKISALDSHITQLTSFRSEANIPKNDAFNFYKEPPTEENLSSVTNKLEAIATAFLNGFKSAGHTPTFESAYDNVAAGDRPDAGAVPAGTGPGPAGVGGGSGSADRRPGPATVLAGIGPSATTTTGGSPATATVTAPPPAPDRRPALGAGGGDAAARAAAALGAGGPGGDAAGRTVGPGFGGDHDPATTTGRGPARPATVTATTTGRGPARPAAAPATTVGAVAGASIPLP